MDDWAMLEFLLSSFQSNQIQSHGNWAPGQKCIGNQTKWDKIERNETKPDLTLKQNQTKWDKIKALQGMKQDETEMNENLSILTCTEFIPRVFKFKKICTSFAIRVGILNLIGQYFKIKTAFI